MSTKTPSEQYEAFYAVKIPRAFRDQHCIIEDEARDNAANTEKKVGEGLIGFSPRSDEYREQFVATISVQMALSDRYTLAFKNWIVKHTGITY